MRKSNYTPLRHTPFYGIIRDIKTKPQKETMTMTIAEMQDYIADYTNEGITLTESGRGAARIILLQREGWTATHRLMLERIEAGISPLPLKLGRVVNRTRLGDAIELARKITHKERKAEKVRRDAEPRKRGSERRQWRWRHEPPPQPNKTSKRKVRSIMPMKIPAHVFDIDNATAERLMRRVVFRRRVKTLAVWLVCLGCVWAVYAIAA